MKMLNTFLTLFLTVSCGALFHAPAYGFQNGPASDGAHGAEGDPGTDGTNGADAADEILIDTGFYFSAGSFNPTTVAANFALAGGDGGNGGIGVDLDGDNNASGGNAGHGGHGGNSLVEWYGDVERGPLDTPGIQTSGYYHSRVFSFGGDGGIGGSGGTAVGSGVSGFGGNGGDGGFAYGHSESILDSHVRVQGGDGGDGIGSGSSGGDGGYAYATGRLRTHSDFSSGEFDIIQYGGSGGNGLQGADGGHGADSMLGVDGQFVNQIDESGLFSFFRGSFSTYGGNGGSTVDGQAGRAGHAYVDMDNIKSLFSSGNRSSQKHMNLHAYGGNGGWAESTGSQDVSAAHGGNAYVKLDDSQIVADGFYSLSISACGGYGGDVRGEDNGGDAGDGGFAISDSVSIESTQSQDQVVFSRRLYGGHGGGTTGTGNAGDGASINQFNDISVTSRGSAELQATSIAGNGGWGMQSNGNGGDAVAGMEEAITHQEVLGDSDTQRYVVRAVAEGGSAGRNLDATNSANGGNAWSSAIQTGNYYVETYSASFAGLGNHGASGDAHAKAHSISTYDGTDFVADVNSTATASRPINNFGENGQPTIGTTAVADAKSFSKSSRAVANSTAEGGWGAVSSGNATAYATAINDNAPNSITYANSSARTLGDDGEDMDNFALSVAYAASQSNALANASASSIGHFVKNQARASVEGISITASATASSSTENWRHDARTTNRIDFNSGQESVHTMNAASYIGFRRNDFGESEDIESHVNVVVAPEESFADSFVAETRHSSTFIDNVDATILGIGKMGVGFVDQDVVGNLSVDQSVSINLELQEFHDDGDLLIGFSHESTGIGFDSLDFQLYYNDDETSFLFRETFTTLESAVAFFDSEVLRLDTLDGDMQEISLQIDIGIENDNVEDSFEIGFVFGAMGTSTDSARFASSARKGLTSVPEPSGAMIVGIWMMVLAGKRRRKSIA